LLFVHIFFLLGFKNRILVMIQWAWSYFTYQRGARLITGDNRLPSWSKTHPNNAKAGLESVSKVSDHAAD
jgi:NADH dehydrogenase